MVLVISYFSLSLTNEISNKHSLAIKFDYTDELPYGITLIGADKVWNRTRGSPEIVVAVLDTGLDANHPDLENILWNNSGETPDNNIDDDKNGYIDDCHGWDFVQNNNDPFSFSLYGSSTSLINHGTHVTGTIAARLNNYGVVGVAPNVTIMTLRVVNENNLNPDITVAEAIRYAADNGAHIISMSIGIYDEELTNATSYQIVEGALEYAFKKEVLIVASAGNDHSIVSRPANNHHVIAVGAIDAAKNIQSYSNQGPEVEFVAPGASVNSTIPGGNYKLSSGTSMAAPHVSGTLALMLSYDQALNNTEARSILQQTVEDLGGEGRDNIFGFGMINVTHAIEIIEEMNTNSTSTIVPSSSSTTSETTTISSTTSNTIETSPTTSESITTSRATLETTNTSLMTSKTTSMDGFLFFIFALGLFLGVVFRHLRKKSND